MEGLGFGLERLVDYFPIERMQEFVVDAARAAKLRHASKLGVEQFLATLVKPTAELARAPISKFHVGAVGLGVSGRIFRGVNLEFPKLPLNHSVHAEQFLVANALHHGEKKLVFVAVSAAPCGHCRFATATTRPSLIKNHLQSLLNVVDYLVGASSSLSSSPSSFQCTLFHREA